MSISLGRVRSLNVLVNIKHPCRDQSHNLILGDQQRSSLLRVQSRSYYKHDIEVKKRIQWQRPVKVRCILPEKSGDLSGLPNVDYTKPPSVFDESPEYQSASDLVKRVVSLQFQPRLVRKEAKINSMISLVRRHKLDSNSVECKIAKFTAIIRNMQVHTTVNPTDKKGKADLKEMIELRKSRLRVLRTFDYKRFEWLLEQLDLMYKPPPTVFERVERKKSMKQLAADYIETVKHKKLEEYKGILDAQKVGFLESKLATMKSINEEEKSFGVQPSFTPEDIQEVEAALRLRILEDTKEVHKETDIKETY